jgi:hypothetical protein
MHGYWPVEFSNVCIERTASRLARYQAHRSAAHFYIDASYLDSSRESHKWSRDYEMLGSFAKQRLLNCFLGSVRVTNQQVMDGCIANKEGSSFGNRASEDV